MIKLTGTTNPFGLQFCDQLHSRLLCLSVLQRLNQLKRCRCFQQERKGRTRESSVQTQTDVLCECNTGSNTGVLVINALLQACMWCLVVLLMCDLCAFPHAVRSNQWSIRVSEDSEFSPFHWQREEVTDRQTPSYQSVFAAGWCGDLMQSESCTHVSPFFPDVGRARSHIWRFYCSSAHRSFVLAKDEWNAWLKRFIILFYVRGRCLTY